LTRTLAVTQAPRLEYSRVDPFNHAIENCESRFDFIDMGINGVKAEWEI
jgi:hypothetical protein